MREGDTRTYAEKGDHRVWIAGNKNDDGKRFCTLQIAARCSIGNADQPRRGQPKLTIVFRGQGKRLSKVERERWHADVNVYFQPKAWFDDDLCLKYARKEVKEICAEAMKAGRETVIICDNLSGQTTKEFANELKKHRCKRHLLPAGVTDELQLIDDGVGVAVKREMGNLFDEWAMQAGSTISSTSYIHLLHVRPVHGLLHMTCILHRLHADNLERWTAEKADDAGVAPMAMWEKRVLITNLAAKAWENVCFRFDFEKVASHLGMRMTVDGSDDDKIKIEGLADYSFCDDDGGELGEQVSDDEGLDEDLLADVEDDAVENEGEEAEGDSAEGFEGGTDEEDGDDEADDDTADTVRSSVGNAPPLNGYRFVEECPELETQQQRLKLLGKTVYVCWDSASLNVHGWYVGTIHSAQLGARDLSNTPTANFSVKYTLQRTNKQLNGCVACELSARLYGIDKWWVLIEKA